MHVVHIYLYKRAEQTMCTSVCVCVCAAAIITKVATRCTLGILKSLISVQQSALLVAPPQHTHTHTRPHFSQTILQHIFLCLAENYLLAKMLFVCTLGPLCRSAPPSHQSPAARCACSLLIYYEAFMREKCLVHPCCSWQLLPPPPAASQSGCLNKILHVVIKYA